MRQELARAGGKTGAEERTDSTVCGLQACALARATGAQRSVILPVRSTAYRCARNSRKKACVCLRTHLPTHPHLLARGVDGQG